MKQIDLDGKILLIDDDGQYRYKVIREQEGKWIILLRDDGYRIYSIHLGETPINPPQGEREWELLWEYKHCEAPGYRSVVEMIMGIEGETIG